MLLDPTPEVDIDLHYWNRAPAALLNHRDALVRALGEIVNGRGEDPGPCLLTARSAVP